MPLELNYHHLYYFWITVRSGSLTAASRELHLSQSALSLQLKSLEGALGRRLLTRTRWGVTPTPEGASVFEHCERIFPQGEALTRSLRDGGERAPVQFRAGMSSSLGRAQVLKILDGVEAVKGLLPMVRVGVAETLIEKLMRHQLDVAVFSFDPSAELGPSYRCRLLDSLPLVFVATKELSERLGPFPRRGRAYPMLLRPPEHPTRRKIEEWMHSHGLGVVAVAETEDADLLRTLALRGRGIAGLNLPLVQEDLAAGRLIRIPGSPRDMTVEIWAAAPLRPSLEPEAAQATEIVLGLGAANAAKRSSRR